MLLQDFEQLEYVPLTPIAFLPQPDIVPQSFSPASLCKHTGYHYYSPVPKF